jgi:hypothetical protein
MTPVFRAVDLTARCRDGAGVEKIRRIDAKFRTVAAVAWLDAPLRCRKEGAWRWGASSAVFGAECQLSVKKCQSQARQAGGELLAARGARGKLETISIT